MRRYLIAGNWKMNVGPAGTTDFFDRLTGELTEVPEKVEVLICPPFVSLPAALAATREQNDIHIGAQNVHFEDNGAYTGEVSTSMLQEVECKYVIIGHSERRQYFGETDLSVNKKVKKSLDSGINPIICVGESLDQRKEGIHETLVKKQVESALNEVEPGNASGIVIAYEPIWAIGTGETATPEQAQRMHEVIRETLAGLMNKELAERIRIVYGGSMKPRNAEELLSQSHVDGGLIGGASLNPESFAPIIRIAEGLS